jgi:hypothetical protein
MSAPSVTGAIALLLQQIKNYMPDEDYLASTIKGLVIHTTDEAGNASGPDYIYGWGLMNAEKAANVIASHFQSYLNIHEYNLKNNETIHFDINVANNTSELKITMAWTDPAGPKHPNQLDPTMLVLVNDLDIEIERNSDGQLFKPWILDPHNPHSPATQGDNIRDNIEQIVINNPSEGPYTVRIGHKNILTNESQDLSLIITGNSSISAPTSTFTRTVDVKLFLEGPYMSSNMSTYISQIPLTQPFNNTPWNYFGDESLVQIPENIVDWILVQLRNKNDESDIIQQKAGLLKNDGHIVDLDGSSPIEFQVSDNAYFIVIYQRNHLSVMSKDPVILD